MSNIIHAVSLPTRRIWSMTAATLRHDILLVAGFLILAAAQSAHSEGPNPGTPDSPKVVLPGPVVVGVNCLSEKQEVELTLLRDKRDQLRRKAQATYDSIREKEERESTLIKTIAHFTDVISGKAKLTEEEEANQVNAAEELIDAFKESVQIKIDIAKDRQDLAITVAEVVSVIDKIEKLEKIEKCPETPGTATGPGTPSTTTTATATTPPEGWTPRTAAFWDKSITIIWEYKDGKQYTAEYFPDGKAYWTYKGDSPDYPSTTPPQKPTSMAGRPIEFKTAAKPQDGSGNIGPVRRKGGEPEDVPTKVEQPQLPAREAFGPPPLGPTVPLGGDPKNPTDPYRDTGAPTNVEQPKLPAKEAFGTPPETKNALGPTTPLGGSDAGWIRIKGSDGKWFWILPTAKSMLPADPGKNAIGPTTPLGGSDAGWKRFQTADGKAYWIQAGTTTMLPAEPPPETKTALGPTTPLGGSDAGWIRIKGSDGKWFWILPTAKSMLPADPGKNAIGPTTPLGGSDAGWKRFQTADGKAYWILASTTTMLPAEPPPETKTILGAPTKQKSVQKKPKGKQIKNANENVSGPTSSDAANIIGTGIAIGVAARGMRRGNDGMVGGGSAQPTRMDSRGAGRPSTGTSGATMNTTVGKPVIKMQGMGVGF